MWEKYDENGNFNPLYKAEEGQIDLDGIDPSSSQAKKEEELSKEE